VNDKKFVCLTIAVFLGLLFTWWILSQPSPCKLIQYQDYLAHMIVGIVLMLEVVLYVLLGFVCLFVCLAMLAIFIGYVTQVAYLDDWSELDD